MGKLERNQNVKNTQFAEDLDEKDYRQWIQKQFLKEAQEIQEKLEEVPDSEEWQPTEKKFQALLKKAKERGLLENTDNPMTSTDDEDRKTKDKVRATTKTGGKEKTTEYGIHGQEIPCGKEKESAETTADSNKESNRKTSIVRFKKKVIKWSAAAAASVVCVFGFAMTSEASRAYVMKEVDKLFGNDINTVVNNDTVLDSERTEDYARQEIENALKVKMPRFYYLPEDMKYNGYLLDVEANMSYLQYLSRDKMIYFRVFSNVETASRFSQSDIGEKIGEISSDLEQQLNIALWKIQEGDEEPTYFLKWEYKNSYYELFGKLSKEDMEQIAKNIAY